MIAKKIADFFDKKWNIRSQLFTTQMRFMTSNLNYTHNNQIMSSCFHFCFVSVISG